MRIQHWLATLMSLLTLGLSGVAQAQSPYGPQSGYGGGQPAGGYYAAGPPPQMAAPPPAAGGPTYGYQQPQVNNDPSVLWPNNAPKGAGPYPKISPFNPYNVSRDSTFRKNGLWFREMLTRKRDYKFELDTLFIAFPDPGRALIGSDIPPFVPELDGYIGGFTIDPRGQGAFIGQGANNQNVTSQGSGPSTALVGTETYPYVFLQAAGEGSPIAAVQASLFPIRNAKELGDDLQATGLRARWGFMDEDGTGVNVTGWYGFRDTNEFRFGTDNFNGVIIRPDDILTTQEQFQQFLLIPGQTLPSGALLYSRNGAIPLDNGRDTGLFGQPFNSFQGSAQKYDVLYELTASTQAWGADLTAYSEPILKGKGIRVRPTYGVEYINLEETFGFRGIDSGIHYEVDGEGVTGGGGGNNLSQTFRPDPGTTVIRHPLLFAHLDSFAESQMAGPEVGLRVDLGKGGGFNIWTQSTFGLLVNRENLKVNGDNIGVQRLTEDADITNDAFFEDVISNNAIFSDEEVNTHVSPLFKQTVNAEINALRYVPIVNKIEVFDEAVFNIGYTLTIIGEVSRPASQIEWRGFPEFSSVQVNRKNFIMNDLNVGVSWTY